MTFGPQTFKTKKSKILIFWVQVHLTWPSLELTLATPSRPNPRETLIKFQNFSKIRSTEFVQKIPKTYTPKIWCRMQWRRSNRSKKSKKPFPHFVNEIWPHLQLSYSSTFYMPYAQLQSHFSRMGSEMTLSARFARADCNTSLILW